jgi:hypothetical protein
VGIDDGLGVAGESPQQCRVSERVEGIQCTLPVDAGEPDEFGMSQMKAVRADPSGICADRVHDGRGDRRLARPRRSGDAEDGRVQAAVASRWVESTA